MYRYLDGNARFGFCFFSIDILVNTITVLQTNTELTDMQIYLQEAHRQLRKRLAIVNSYMHKLLLISAMPPIYNVRCCIGAAFCDRNMHRLLIAMVFDVTK